MKKIVSFITAICMIATLNISVLAAEPTMTANANIDGYVITINGVLNNPIKVGNQSKNEILITMLNPQVAATPIGGVEANNILHMASVVAGENGEFTYTYTFGSGVNSGYIPTIISALGVGEYKISVQYFATIEQAQDFVNTFNKKDLTATQLKDYFDINVPILGSEVISAYSGFADKIRFCEIVNNILKVPEFKCNNINDVKVATKIAIAVEQANVITDITAFEKHIRDNKAILDIDLDNVLFSQATDKVKTATLDVISKSINMSKKALYDNFYNTLSVNVVNDSDKSNIVSNVKKYNKFIGVPQTYLDKYDNFSVAKQKMAVSQLVNKYKDVQNIVATFTSVIDTVASSSTPSGGGGGGGSSSGGGSSNTVVKAPVIPKQEIPEPIITTENESQFTDLSDYEWAKKAIASLAKKEIINGKSDTEFAPQDNATREEFVKIVTLAFSSVDDKAKVKFSDVSDEQWYYSFIATAVKNGVIKGVSDSVFGVGEFVTREDACVIIYRSIKEKITAGSESIAPPKDIDMVSEYAQESVLAMWNAGLIGGNEGEFMPKDNATRAEIAQMIYTCISHIDEKIATDKAEGGKE